MSKPYKEAVAICKTILRNGFDAYIIDPHFQNLSDVEADVVQVDIATDMSIDELIKFFPAVQTTKERLVKAVLKEGHLYFRFYPADVVDGAHPESTVTRISPRMLKELAQRDDLPLDLVCPYLPKTPDLYHGFGDLSSGNIVFTGIPDETLKLNYLIGIRALRFAANYHLPIEPNTWMAIVRGATKILDYVPIAEIMDEWRKVEAENLHSFVRMLFDAQILHGLIPEVAALSRVKQVRNESGAEELVFDHTIETMRRYPEELPYDWYGTMACLFHDVGKLFTAEYFQGKWNFYQHHHVGAKITRQILIRLMFLPADVDLISKLVRHHMRFHVMLTDKGVRRFKAIDEYPRLIEMARADIKAREGSYAAFNHNMKILERADISEELLEPLLNGNEIMDFTGLRPGPSVGLIREALLQAQISGDVTSVPEAVEFVCRYSDNEKLK